MSNAKHRSLQPQKEMGCPLYRGLPAPHAQSIVAERLLQTPWTTEWNETPQYVYINYTGVPIPRTGVEFTVLTSFCLLVSVYVFSSFEKWISLQFSSVLFPNLFLVNQLFFYLVSFFQAVTNKSVYLNHVLKKLFKLLRLTLSAIRLHNKDNSLKQNRFNI